MRIAYVVNRYATGGLKTLLLSYSQRLDPARFRVDYLVSQVQDNGPYPEVEDFGGRVVKLPKLSRNPLGYVLAARRAMVEGRYTIVQSAMNSLNPFALVAAKGAGISVRISYSLSSSHPSERTAFIKNVLRRFGRCGATVAAANSRLSGEWLFGDNASFDVIPNPVDLRVYRPDRHARDILRSELGLEGCYVIGHIGRYEHQKNHEGLMRIFDAVARADSTARLVLVGWGPLKERVLAFADDLGLGEKIVDLGRTEDIAGLYNAFDCFVLPSYYEGSPVVGLEAQATGCPCVFSTEVTREACLNETVSYVGLDEPLDVWADRILGFKGAVRKVSPQVAEHDADLLAERLAGYYGRLAGVM